MIQWPRKWGFTMARKVAYTRLSDAAHAILTELSDEIDRPISSIISEIIDERLGLEPPPAVRLATALKRRSDAGKAA